jgi:hypothetical protein
MRIEENWCANPFLSNRVLNFGKRDFETFRIGREWKK